MTTAKMNRLKCHGPARQLAILGMLLDSVNKPMYHDTQKTAKIYRSLEKISRKEGNDVKRLRKNGEVPGICRLGRAIWEAVHFSFVFGNSTTFSEQGNHAHGVHVDGYKHLDFNFGNKQGNFVYL